MLPQVIVVGGLPGTGKSTLSRAMSRALDVPCFSKDELEAAVVRRGLCSSAVTQGVGFEIMSALVKNQIQNNSSAICDFVAAKQRVLEEWPALLESHLKYIECICSNEDIHRHRINSRRRNIEGWYELSWEDVVAVKRSFEPLVVERLVLDSVASIEENLAQAVTYVSEQSM